MGALIRSTIFLCFISAALFGQQIDVIYTLKFRPKKEDSITLREVMLLRIEPGVGRSWFGSIKKYQNESISEKISSPPSQLLIDGLEATGDFHFYTQVLKDVRKDTYRLIDQISERLYEIEYKAASSWQILPARKRVGDYECNAAQIKLGGRLWKVWFAPDLPFSDGPYKLSGLPGLILEAATADGDYHFAFTALQKTTEPRPTIPFALKTTNDRIQKLKEKTAKDPSAAYKQAISKIGNHQVTVNYNGKESSSDRNYAREIDEETWRWLEDHNNPIEKEDIWLR